MASASEVCPMVFGVRFDVKRIHTWEYYHSAINGLYGWFYEDGYFKYVDVEDESIPCCYRLIAIMVQGYNE